MQFPVIDLINNQAWIEVLDVGTIILISPYILCL